MLQRFPTSHLTDPLTHSYLTYGGTASEARSTKSRNRQKGCSTKPQMRDVDEVLISSMLCLFSRTVSVHIVLHDLLGGVARAASMACKASSYQTSEAAFFSVQSLLQQPGMIFSPRRAACVVQHGLFAVQRLGLSRWTYCTQDTSSNPYVNLQASSV